MKIIQYLLDKIVAPLFVGLLLTIIIAIASKINTGDWIEWFGLIPNTWWIGFGLVISLWVIIIAIRNRVKQTHESDSISFASVPRFGWVPIIGINYAGVGWRIRAPATAPWESSMNYPSSIDVETPPRCPKCETEIEQSRGFWGGYIWKCVRCDFQKRNRDSYYKEKKRVKKIAKRELESQIDNDSGV